MVLKRSDTPTFFVLGSRKDLGFFKWKISSGEIKLKLHEESLFKSMNVSDIWVHTHMYT